RTSEMHRILIRSLVVQALLPVAIVIIPFGSILALTSVQFNISLNIYDNIPIYLADIALLCISFHSSAHCAALILTTPVFRKTFIEV
ncbi:hypothetical protein PENTCL1PPCAC_24287, partial [Pristionchus entomophagus]